MLSPADAEKIDLLKKNNEVNNFVGDPYSAAQLPLWGMARIVSDVIATGTAIVGDFSRAWLFDREETSIAVGTVADDFIRNIVRVLAEVRAAFGIVRPAAFCITTLN